MNGWKLLLHRDKLAGVSASAPIFSTLFTETLGLYCLAHKQETYELIDNIIIPDGQSETLNGHGE